MPRILKVAQTGARFEMNPTNWWAIGRGTAIAIAATCLLTGMPARDAAAQPAGCDGQNPSTSQSVALTARLHQETLEKAKSAAGIAGTPTYAGVSFSGSLLKHDGYGLEQPVAQNGCQNPPPLTGTSSFETRTYSISALGEMDLTSAMNMPAGYTLRSGIAIGSKHLRTKTSDIISIWDPGNTAATTNFGPSRLEEDGIQIDTYTLITKGASYAIIANSFGFGDADISFNTVIAGPGPVARRTGTTDYRDYAFSATLGHVFTLRQSSEARTVADLSGGLAYTSHERDGFNVGDGENARIGDAETNEFSGKFLAKFAHQVFSGNDAFTVYMKGGVLYRFHYESTYSTSGLGPDGPSVTQNFSLTTDDAVGIAGGGIAFALDGDNVTGVLDGEYRGSGDSDEYIGKAQFVFKLN
ncbi:MAG: hypothetical protein ACR2PI_18350 [Hyphomicrobiaceae bacterium]